jgi:hypothetical protein
MQEPAIRYELTDMGITKSTKISCLVRDGRGNVVRLVLDTERQLVERVCIRDLGLRKPQAPPKRRS